MIVVTKFFFRADETRRKEKEAQTVGGRREDRAKARQPTDAHPTDINSYPIESILKCFSRSKLKSKTTEAPSYFLAEDIQSKSTKFKFDVFVGHSTSYCFTQNAFQ